MAWFKLWMDWFEAWGLNWGSRALRGLRRLIWGLSHLVWCLRGMIWSSKGLFEVCEARFSPERPNGGGQLDEQMDVRTDAWTSPCVFNRTLFPLERLPKKTTKMPIFGSFMTVLSLLGTLDRPPRGFLALICVPHHQIHHIRVSYRTNYSSINLSGETTTKSSLIIILAILGSYEDP